MNEAEQLKIFTELPCLSGGCLHWKADGIRAAIGAVYLALERGQQPKIPSRCELMSDCCQQPQKNVVAIAITPWLKPGARS